MREFLSSLPLPVAWIVAIVGIILVVLLVKLIIAVFHHPLYSRIAGILVAIGSFVVGLILPNAKDAEPGIVFEYAIYLAVLYTFYYLFSMSAEVFDTYWDGSYTLSISKDSIDLSKTISGGFFENFFGSAFITYILSIFALSSLGFLIWLIPIVLAIVNICLLVSVIRG